MTIHHHPSRRGLLTAGLVTLSAIAIGGLNQGSTTVHATAPVARVNYVDGFSVALWKDAPQAVFAGRKLQANSAWQTFGAVAANTPGDYYLNVGGNQYLLSRYADFQGETSSQHLTGVGQVRYVKGYGIAIWSDPKAGNQHLISATRKLNHGSRWQVLERAVVNGNVWYNLGGNQWVQGAHFVLVKETNRGPKHYLTANPLQSLGKVAKPSTGNTGTGQSSANRPTTSDKPDQTVTPNDGKQTEAEQQAAKNQAFSDKAKAQAVIDEARAAEKVILEDDIQTRHELSDALEQLEQAAKVKTKADGQVAYYQSQVANPRRENRNLTLNMPELKASSYQINHTLTDAEYAEAEKGQQINEFQPNPAEQSIIIHNRGELPEKDIQDMNVMFLNLINQSRHYFGKKPLKISKSSYAFAQRIAEQYRSDQWFSQGHDVSGINRMAAPFGLVHADPSFPAKFQFYECLGMTFFTTPTETADWTDWNFNPSLDYIKQQAYDSMLAMMFYDGKNPGHAQSLFGFMNDDVGQDDVEYFGFSIDAFGQVHFIVVNDSYINEPALFDKTEADFVKGVTSADNQALVTALAKAKVAAQQAEQAKAAAQAVVDAKTNHLEALKKQRADKEKAIADAKAVIAQAKKMGA